MAEIVDIISEISFEDIPEKAKQAARLCLLDAVGCMVGGMKCPAVLNLAQTISQKNPGTTNIAATSLSSTRPWASFVNSHACSFFDLDDGHRRAQGHPGGVIVPLSLMMAAENGCSGKELLTAIVIGYEIGVRGALIMRHAGGPRKGSGGWSITGGVAAVAKLLKLPPRQINNALGLAEYFAPQAPQDRSLAYPSSMKEGMAWASYSAISIVELAAAGFDSMTPYLADANQGSDAVFTYEICSVYFKMHACCRFSHPVIDGLANLVQNHDFLIEDIDSVMVASFEKAMLLSHMAPENPVAAMYSIPYIIGCYLVRGKVGPQEMVDDSLTDPKILEIAKRVVLQEDPSITDQ
ncbi:MAG: MmgE/PrpD family protein, partial [Deltaproteobacteria bacterium]|nr:MmgE/PrpD family protein [Deltaproteobacteria bacterium]